MAYETGKISKSKAQEIVDNYNAKYDKVYDKLKEIADIDFSVFDGDIDSIAKDWNTSNSDNVLGKVRDSNQSMSEKVRNFCYDFLATFAHQDVEFKQSGEVEDWKEHNI